MSAVTHMVLAAINSRVVSESQVSGGTGTNIGDMTARGGLAASFDGNTSQGITVGSSKQADTSVTPAYIGKNYSPAKAITKVVCYGSNNQGFKDASNPTITLNLRGDSTNTGPSGGTLLGTLSFTDTSNESAGRTITSSDPWTKYNYVWVSLSAGNVGAADTGTTEVVFFENTNA